MYKRQILEPLANLISMFALAKPFVPKLESVHSGGIIDKSPDGPPKQTLRKSPKVGATTALMVFGFLKAYRAMSCAPVLVLPQPRPASINQIK